MKAAAFITALLLGGGAAAAGSGPIDELAGRYDRQVKRVVLPDEPFQADDVLEIVRIDADRAYVRTHLWFTNAHTCSLHGVAREEGLALVYRATNLDGSACTLRIERQAASVILRDDGTCAIGRCGARGGFDRISLPARSRRTITYMARLKGSKEYADALAEDLKAKSR